MKIADFRIQTTAPDAPSDGVIGLYATSNGLVMKSSDSVLTGVSTPVLHAYVNGQIVTGGASSINTGSYWGPDVGGNKQATGLALPNVWLRFNVSGTNYGVPAYALR